MPRKGSNLRPVVILDGYPMRKKCTSRDHLSETYHCVERERKTGGCRASIVLTISDKTYRVISEHTHERNETDANAELLKSELRAAGRSSGGSKKDTMNAVRANYSPYEVIRAGNVPTFRKMMDRAKREDPNRKLVDQTGDVLGVFRETLNGQNFLFSETVVNGKKIKIFASSASIEALAKSDTVFCDCTFDGAPNPYVQVWSLHCYITREVVRPAVFALLESKEKVMYDKILELIRKAPEIQNWNPTRILTDFELALRDSFCTAFPTIEPAGCLFHILQNWLKNAKNKHKLGDDIASGGSLEIFYRRLQTLPYLPAADIPTFFADLLKTLPPNSVAGEFTAYLDKWYVNGTGGRPARYPPQTWTVADRTLEGVHRTTNVVEAWHRNFRKVTSLTGGLRPVRMTELINFLKTEERQTAMDFQALQIDPLWRAKSSRRNTNIAKDQALMKVLKNTPNPPNVPLSGMQLLDAIAGAAKIKV